MGNYFGSERLEKAQNVSRKGTKRIHEELEDETEQLKIDMIEDELLNTPKRRKLTTTSEYIYDTLFKSGENSDVTIHALGRSWNLHKVYLCQSGYFSSMFNMQWVESNKNEIHIDIPDDNIDREALDITFGSLYRDDISIKPTMVVQVLAAATLLSLDGLIQQCTAVMLETISAKSVCDYHTASVMYGQISLTNACRSWLERNVMMSQSIDLLREIDTELMTEIIHSQNLFVMQVEMDVYSMLKKWLFLQFHPSWQGTLKELIHEAEVFFRAQAQTAPEFLLTNRGTPYIGPFQALRLLHIINDLPSTKIIEADCIIPKSWLLPVYRKQWLQMLRVEQGHDKGPEKRCKRIEEKFTSMSLRCGRILQKDGQYCWRWTGYNFGLDILISFTSRLILIKRNTLSQSFPGATSMQHRRSILFSMEVCSLNKLGHVTYKKNSGVKQLNLGKDQEQVIMVVDRKADFPLHISCCFMTYKPKGQSQGHAQSQGQSPANQDAVLVHLQPEASSSDDSSSDDGDPNNLEHHHGNQDIRPQEDVQFEVDDNVAFF